MIARVYVPDASVARTTAAIPADEARWLRDVLRLRAGDAVRVFDGRGREWDATIAALAREAGTVALDAPRLPQPEPRVRYTVVLPALKGDAADAVVRDVVMMGAATIVPVVTDRTEIGRAAFARGQRQARWQRIAVASAKQSGRAVVPVIAAPASFEAAVATTPQEDLRLLFVEPAIATAGPWVGDLPAPGAAVMATGPEGGWTVREVEMARDAGWQLVRLGGRVLRAEAAPLVAMAACQAVWRDA